MHFNYSLDSLSHLPATLIVLALFGGVVWLYALVTALARKDLDPVTKFMWVFVVVTTFFIGALLYLFMLPSEAQVRQASIDYTREPTTCVNCRTTIPAGSSVCPKCGWSYISTKASSAG